MFWLITGASGFVGTRLSHSLSRFGAHGLCVSRKCITRVPEGWYSACREEIISGCYSFTRIPDCVIHLEVKQHVDSPTVADLSAFREVNVEGTRQWLNWCTQRGVSRFLLFSTIKAVGDSGERQVESREPAPNGPYGQSKRAAEELVRAWVAESPFRSAVILRPAVIYGPGNTANVFAMVRAIDRGRFLLIGRNDNVKSLVSIENVCAAVEHVLRYPEPGVAVYNLVDRSSYSVREIAEMVATELGRKGPIWSLPPALAALVAESEGVVRRIAGCRLPLTRSRLKAMTEKTHFDGSKLVASGFVHPQTTQEGIREMVKWYREMHPRS